MSKKKTVYYKLLFNRNTNLLKLQKQLLKKREIYDFNFVYYDKNFKER